MSNTITTHAFEFELTAWSDTHYGGQTSKFRIHRESDGREHPFKQFTRRRGGRAGSRFHATFVRVGEDKPMFDAALMLNDWGESKAAAEYAGFWHDETEIMHPFKGEPVADRKTGGQRYMVALVEVEDDEGVQDARAKHEPRRQRSIVEFAGALCALPRFHEYLTQRVDATAVWDQDRATKYVRAICGVESRKELLTNQTAARRFHELVRRPFQEFVDG